MPLFPEHPRRHDIARQIARLDAVADAQAIYRLTTLYELPWESRYGLNLAFYRTFAVPKIAEVLARSGEIAREPQKRTIDTGLLMYELIEHGFEHDRGRAVVRSLNRVHAGWGIDNDDFTYVLAALVVVPTRWIDEYGWRPLTAHERHATVEFYRQLGHRMNIRDVPTSYDEFAALLDAYDAEHLAPSAAGRQHMRATTWVIAEALPRPVRRLAPLLTTALADEQLCRALGLTPAAPLTKATARALFRIRRPVLRRMPARRDSWFAQPHGSGVYGPHGYQIEDLGPSSARSGPPEHGLGIGETDTLSDSDRS